MSRDFIHNVRATQAMNPATFSATTNGTTVDTQGFESLTFMIAVGTNGGNAFSTTDKVTFTVEEGDQADASDMAGITTAEYLAAARQDGTTWDRILDATADDQEVYSLGVQLNTKRYKRVVATEAGTVSAVIIGAIAALGHAHHAPV